MGNYDNATQVQDATYALLNALFRAKRYINGVFVETMAELKTDTYSITGFVPALLSPISNVPYIINTNDCLSISIDKAGAGKIVGSGVWQLVGKLV